MVHFNYKSFNPGGFSWQLVLKIRWSLLFLDSNLHYSIVFFLHLSDKPLVRSNEIQSSTFSNIHKNNSSSMSKQLTGLLHRWNSPGQAFLSNVVRPDVSSWIIVHTHDAEAEALAEKIPNELLADVTWSGFFCSLLGLAGNICIAGRCHGSNRVRRTVKCTNSSLLLSKPHLWCLCHIIHNIPINGIF